MSLFCLAHGSTQNEACWDLPIPELERTFHDRTNWLRCLPLSIEARARTGRLRVHSLLGRMRYKELDEMKLHCITCFALLSLRAIAQQTIREAPISRFPALPTGIQKNLRSRGCTVPQPPGSRKPENVIRGSFRDPKQIDWAVLCDIRSTNTSMILVYWNQNPSHPAVLGRSPLSNGNCWSTISPVGKAYIMEHYRAYGGPKPPVIDHQGIDVGICEKASTISYFYRNRWLTLTGAD